MLEDTDVIPVCEFWAKVYCTKKFEYQELVNVGYLAGKPLDEVKLLQKYIKFAIIKFINKTLTSNTNVNDSVFNNCPCDKVIDSELNASQVEFETILSRLDDVGNQYKNSVLRKHTREILIWRVVDGLSYTKIADKLGVTKQTVARFANKLFTQLRSVVKEREHMLRN